MRNSAKVIGFACVAILVALYVVGAASHASLRHEVQTLPLWCPIVLGFRGRELAKWVALPCLIFWFAIVALIWLFLLGWAHVLSGHFSTVEIAMTILIGAACLTGAAACLGWKTKVKAPAAVATMVLFAGLQLLAFRISLIPFIAHQ